MPLERLGDTAYVGIDPGKSGGIAILGADQWEAETHKIADLTLRDLWELLASLEPAVCILEKVSASPQMGVVSAFKFGWSFGSLHMGAVAAGLRVELVTPQKWQRHFGLIVKGRGLGQRDVDKKNRNKAKAQELFPAVKVTHAIADALLLADYGRKHTVMR